MAQLKNTVVQGSLKATDTIYSSTGQFQIIKAPTTSGGSTYGPGTSGQVLKSNGSSVYWATDNNNTYYAPTTAGTAGQFLKAVGGTSAPTWNNIYYSDIKPAIKKTYASTSYYATAAGDNAKSAFYFMNVRPNSWNQPWTVKFKVHSFCPNYPAYQSTTVCTLSGRQQDIIYHNWNEQINAAHTYISMLRLKEAGYNAGLGHAVGIDIISGGNYTNSNYYRTFEVEYYECDACEVTLLDAPVLRANWSNYNTTNYNGISNYDASNRGLRESGEENDIYTSMINCPRIVTGSSVGIGRYTLFMETADGTYQSITSTFNSTGTSHIKNSALFRPERIFYRNSGSDLAANNSTNNDNGWMHQQTSLIDLRYSTNCGKTLVGRKPVYLVGTIDANGFFTLRSENENHTVSWWTQTEPTEEDGYVYIYLGRAYTQDESNNLNTQYRVAFELDNPIYWYKNGKFILYDSSQFLDSAPITNTNLNTLTSVVYKARLYSLYGVGGNGCTNLPIGDGEAFGLLSYPTAAGLLTQELSSNATATIGKWLRWYSASSNTWTAWQKVITDSTGDFTKRVWVAASPGYLRIIDNQYFSDNRVYLDFTIGSTSGKQGILSSGYYTKADRSAFVENSKWLVYRDVGGDVYLNGSALSLKGNTGITTDADIDTSGLTLTIGGGSSWTGSESTMAYGPILNVGNSMIRIFQLWSTGRGNRVANGPRLLWRHTADVTTDNVTTQEWQAARTILDEVNYTSYLDSTYLKLSGGNLTGAVNFANNVWNKVGDDVRIGDINKGGHLGIQGINANTGIFFTTYNQSTNSTGGAITWDGTKFSITSTTPVAANISGSAKYLTNLGRLTSANLDSSSAEYLNKAFVFYASQGSMTKDNGYPDKDSVIFHCSWDNSTWASQLALPINRATDRSVQWRGSDNNAWGDWRTLLDSNNYTNYLDSTYLKLSGGTMTGELKTSFNGAVAIGSRESKQKTIENLCEEMRYSSGCMGSVVIETAYTHNGITIPTGWYTYIWVPHRSGGLNGEASGDNCNYGTLYLNSMTAVDTHNSFVVRYGYVNSTAQILITVANANFNSLPVDGQVLIGTGTYGHIKSSGYTIAKSVPSDAVFTDNKVQQSTSVSANWRKIMLGKREMSSPNTALETITDVIYGAQAIEAQPSTGTLRAMKYRVANNVELQWNSTDSSLDFVFI